MFNKKAQFNSQKGYNHSFAQMYLLIENGFSGEQCGPWASCLVFFYLKIYNMGVTAGTNGIMKGSFKRK